MRNFSRQLLRMGRWNALSENRALDKLGQLPPWTWARWGKASLVNNVVWWELPGKTLTSLRTKAAPGTPPSCPDPLRDPPRSPPYNITGDPAFGERGPMTPMPENVPMGRPPARPPESRGRSQGCRGGGCPCSPWNSMSSEGGNQQEACLGWDPGP